MLRSDEQVKGLDQETKESDGSEIYIDSLSQLANQVATEMKSLKSMPSKNINNQTLNENIQFWKERLQQNLDNLKNLNGIPNEHVKSEKKRWEALLIEVNEYEKSLQPKSSQEPCRFFPEIKRDAPAVETPKPVSKQCIIL